MYSRVHVCMYLASNLCVIHSRVMKPLTSNWLADGIHEFISAKWCYNLRIAMSATDVKKVDYLCFVRVRGYAFIYIFSFAFVFVFYVFMFCV